MIPLDSGRPGTRAVDCDRFPSPTVADNSLAVVILRRPTPLRKGPAANVPSIPGRIRHKPLTTRDFGRLVVGGSLAASRIAVEAGGRRLPGPDHLRPPPRPPAGP